MFLVFKYHQLFLPSFVIIIIHKVNEMTEFVEGRERSGVLIWVCVMCVWIFRNRIFIEFSWNDKKIVEHLFWRYREPSISSLQHTHTYTQIQWMTGWMSDILGEADVGWVEKWYSQIPNESLWFLSCCLSKVTNS